MTGPLELLERLVQRGNLRATVLVEADVPERMPIDDLMSNPPTSWRAVGSPTFATGGR